MMTAQSITADYNLESMIGYLRGQLVDKRTNQVLVDVHGVGYQVSIPLSTFFGTPSAISARTSRSWSIPTCAKTPSPCTAF